MNTLMMPVSEVVYILNNESIYDELRFLKVCSFLLDDGLDFPDAWRQSVLSCKLRLKKEEINKLSVFSTCIGKTDTENQTRTICLFREYFIRQYEFAENERKKYTTPIIISGFLFGCALFILLM